MNRKHLRSLAAVQRGKKNVRSLEEKAEIFGDSPLETTNFNRHPDISRANPNAWFTALTSGKVLILEDNDRVLPEDQQTLLQAVRVRAIVGDDTPVKDPAKLIDDLLTTMRNEIVDSTPEQFFLRLQYDVSRMMDQAMELGSSIILAKTPARRDELQRIKKDLSDRARDIVIFMMPARGMEVPVPVEQVEVVDLSGFPRTGIPSKRDWIVGMDPALPDSVSKTIQRYVGSINIEDTYPKTQEVPLEVAAEMAVKNKPFSEDIHNNDVAKSYPKSDCLPVGFADEVIAKEKPNSEE